MWWTYSIAFLCTIVGFGLCWWVIKHERRPSMSDDVLLSWTEPPVSAWRQDWKGGLFITLHSLSIIILGILFLLDTSWSERNHTLFLLDATPFMPTTVRHEFYQSLYILATCGLGVVWVICGGFLFFPIATRLIRPIYIMIVPNGVVRGPYIWSWDYFSHFVVYPSTRLIRFYSSRIPEIACMAWQPSSEDTFNQAAVLLGQYLPQNSPRTSVPWYRRRSVSIGLRLFLITVPCVGIGLLVYIFEFTWAWMYYTFVTPLIPVFSFKLFRQL